MMPDRCEAVAKNGKPCSATPAPGLTRCAWHAPEWAERRREWSVRGGKGRSNAARAKRQLPAGILTADELRGLVGLTIRGVLANKVEPGVGNSVANLARAYVAVTEATEHEERLAELERLAAVQGGRTA